MQQKDPAFSFKTNIPEKILFQSDVVKEGDSQYGHWKLYKIQVSGKDYVFFPSKYLQDQLDKLGNLSGRLLNLGKFESEDNKTRWEIDGQNYATSPSAPQNTQNPTPATQNDSEAILRLTAQLKTRFSGLDAEIKKLREDVAGLKALIPDDKMDAFEMGKGDPIYDDKLNQAVDKETGIPII